MADNNWNKGSGEQSQPDADTSAWIAAGEQTGSGGQWQGNSEWTGGNSRPGASQADNQRVIGILRSANHYWMSGHIMVITFSGRKTGNSYSTPISYMRDGDTITCFSNSKWVQNLEGGAAVSLTLLGQEVSGFATPTSDPQLVYDGLRTMVAHDPDDAQYFGVGVDANGQPNEADLQLAASKNTKIEIRLN